MTTVASYQYHFYYQLKIREALQKMMICAHEGVSGMQNIPKTIFSFTVAVGPGSGGYIKIATKS